MVPSGHRPIELAPLAGLSPANHLPRLERLATPPAAGSTWGTADDSSVRNGTRCDCRASCAGARPWKGTSVRCCAPVAPRGGAAVRCVRVLRGRRAEPRCRRNRGTFRTAALPPWSCSVPVSVGPKPCFLGCRCRHPADFLLCFPPRRFQAIGCWDGRRRWHGTCRLPAVILVAAFG